MTNCVVTSGQCGQKTVSGTTVVDRNDFVGEVVTLRVFNLLFLICFILWCVTTRTFFLVNCQNSELKLSLYVIHVLLTLMAYIVHIPHFGYLFSQQVTNNAVGV